MCDYNDLVTLFNETLGQLKQVRLDAAHVRVEKVRHQTDFVTHDQRYFFLNFALLQNLLFWGELFLDFRLDFCGKLLQMDWCAIQTESLFVKYATGDADWPLRRLLTLTLTSGAVSAHQQELTLTSEATWGKRVAHDVRILGEVYHFLRERRFPAEVMHLLMKSAAKTTKRDQSFFFFFVSFFFALFFLPFIEIFHGFSRHFWGFRNLINRLKTKFSCFLNVGRIGTKEKSRNSSGIIFLPKSNLFPNMRVHGCL